MYPNLYGIEICFLTGEIEALRFDMDTYDLCRHFRRA